MAYDFPLAPTVGQVYEDPTSGAAYIWNGWAWDLVAGGDLTDYVLKAGDTMTGELTMSNGGISFGAQAVAAANDHSKHLHLWDSGTNGGFGINITSGRMNYNVEASGNSHWFRVANVDKVKIDNGGLQSQGHVESLSSGLYATGCNVHARSGGKFVFRTDDRNAWRTALDCEDCHLQYIEGGNNDGRFRIWTSNGGYTDNWVMETTIVNGMPGVNFGGRVNVGSGDSYGITIGDHWHGWAWSQTSNCEHLRSYQGKFEFRHTNNTLPGTVFYTMDTVGSTGNSVNVTAPEALALGDELNVARANATEMGDSVDIVKMMAAMLLKIKALENEVATLKGRK